MSKLATSALLDPDPAPGLTYPRVLSGPDVGIVRPLFGVMLGITAFMLLTPLTTQLLQGLFWLLRGREGTFTEYAKRANAYEVPEGIIAGHLGLAMLIVISVVLVRFWHGRTPKWLMSVQPGMRWRYLIFCLIAAAAVQQAVLWLTRIGLPSEWSVVPKAWLWIVLILLFTPLQSAAEEIFFRGYLTQATGAMVKSPWFGVVTSSLIFAAFHGVQNGWLFANRFAFGLLAGTLVVITGGLEAAIAAHVANNLFAFGYGVFSGGVAKVKAVTYIGPKEAISNILGFALVAAVTALIGRGLKVANRTP